MSCCTCNIINSTASYLKEQQAKIISTVDIFGELITIKIENKKPRRKLSREISVGVMVINCDSFYEIKKYVSS